MTWAPARSRAAAAWLALALLTAAAGARAEPEGVRKLAGEVGDIETQVALLVRAHTNPTAIVRKFPNHKRLIDARVFYELGQFENAAMVLFDVLERPDFRGHLEFEATQLLLGDCLLKMNNLQAARDLFLKVAEGRDAHLAEEARLFLLELALSNPDSSEEVLRRAVADVAQMVGTATSERTRYGLGKAELRLGNPVRAIEELEVIPTQSPLYLRARFYLGAAYVANGQVDLGLEVFRALTGIKGRDDITRELKDQAWLAVGRLLVQRGDFDLGLTSYQNIDRYSPHYEEAVYEMSWAYINQEKFDKALQTVEVLLLTVANDQHEIDAHVLRGQLNVMIHDYDEALASYQTIVTRFAPVRNELAQFTKRSEAIQRYFRWLLERKQGTAKLDSPLSEKTLKWLASNADFSRVSSVFERIADERHDIEEARDAGQVLDQLLARGSRVAMFPELQRGWTQALILENQLVLLATRMLDKQYEAARDRLGDRDEPELSEIIAWRRRLEGEAARLPTTFEAYEARQDEVMRRFRELERKGFFVEEALDEVQRQLLGIERFLDAKQYAEDGKKLTPAQEESLRGDIAAEKAELQAMYAELVALKKKIQLETSSVGTGDEATRGEDSLKSSLLAALAREGAFYDALGKRVGGSFERDAKTFAGLRGRIVDAVGALDRVVGAIDKEVGEKTAELSRMVRNELEHLQGYQAEADGLDRQGRELALRMGEEFFARALTRMDQVVLDAEVGLLDVMWARKTDKTREIQHLTEEQARRLRQLHADLESIKSGAADEAAERRELPTPDAPPADAPTAPDEEAP